MCLKRITRTYPRGISGYGWKVFTRHRNGKDLIGDIFVSFVYKVNRWYRAKGEEGRQYLFIGNEFYRKGFHVFLEKKGAETWLGSWTSSLGVDQKKVIRKVRFRGGHTKGYQGTIPSVIVAEEMKIVRRRDE